ncbi:MAG: hypothetical protein ACRDRA_06105 [Pseudonocardiaceae bacterium]
MTVPVRGRVNVVTVVTKVSLERDELVARFCLGRGVPQARPGKRTLEEQPGKHIGDLVGQHRGGMEFLPSTQPFLAVGARGRLMLTVYQQGDNHVGIEDDTHRSTPRSARASCTKTTASADGCW